MIPLRLQVRNFMCYAENVPPLLLDGVHVVCLSGDNGHGKSALLDAMTWALWGRARGKGDDDLVHSGKTEMEVEMEFMVGGEPYRVIRKRALKGKRGTTILEFQIGGEGSYRPITGDTVHETQRRIIRALRMEYETFVNSAMLLQGRADEFTIKPPAERKKVLADVLGLGVYDELEGRARQEMRLAEQVRRELTAVLAEIDRELAQRPEYQELRDRLADDLEVVSRELTIQEAERRAALSAKQALDTKRQRVDEMRLRQQRDMRQLAQVETQLAADHAELSGHERLLAEAPAIERRYQRLLALRAENDELAKVASRMLGLRQTEARLAQAVAAGRSALEADVRVQQAAVSAAWRKASQRPEVERELAPVQREIEQLAGLEATRDSLRETVQRHRGEAQSLKTANDGLREAMGALKQKIDVLAGDGASCPVCGSQLGDEGRARLAASYQDEGKRLGEEYRRNAALVKECEAEAARVLAEESAVDGRLAGREALRRRAGGLERALAEAAEADGEGRKASESLAAAQHRLDQGDYARAEQESLAKVRADVAALNYDEHAHAGLRAELSELAGAEEQRAAVQKSGVAAELLHKKIGQAQETARQQREGLAELGEQVDELSREIAAGGRVLQELAEVEDRVDALGKRAGDLRLRLGRAEQLLSQCDYQEQQRREKGAALGKAADEQRIYEDLAIAFGKKGIQAMIIDGAMPEIEEEANHLLSRLTDGRMNVKVETQRESKSGDNVIETLDIKIADELGYRQYEMYSGGEAFRVNFAIRIALSKLLARRAGARLQTLIIDEGFGTQDAAGRERLVEAINTVSEDFERILVITHIQELKDAFPVRIDVVKTAEGSRFSMVE